jgi:LacI family transcriptional regulator
VTVLGSGRNRARSPDTMRDVQDDGRAERTSQPTLHDVAAAAAVSIATVSNVLNHPEKVAPATLERVTAAIGALGFSRNNMARALASGSTRTFGLIVPSFRNSLFVDVAEGAQRTASVHGYRLQLANAEADLAAQNDHIEFFTGARVTGMLFAPMQNSRFEVMRLRRQGVPVVLLNYRAAEHDLCTVLVDNEQVGYLAARHLIELGRRHIALAGGRYDLQPTSLRRRGVLRAMSEAGDGVRFEELVVADLEAVDGAEAGRRLVDRQDRPDAVLAVTDLLGMAIISELVTARIRVPQDVAVMGCDHNSAAWGGAIPLTSASMCGEEMGEEGVRLLLEELDLGDAHVHRTVVLQPHLVIRESTVGRDAMERMRAGPRPLDTV